MQYLENKTKMLEHINGNGCGLKLRLTLNVEKVWLLSHDVCQTLQVSIVLFICWCNLRLSFKYNTLISFMPIQSIPIRQLSL